MRRTAALDSLRFPCCGVLAVAVALAAALPAQAEVASATLGVSLTIAASSCAPAASPGLASADLPPCDGSAPATASTGQATLTAQPSPNPAQVTVASSTLPTLGGDPSPTVRLLTITY